MIRFAGRSILHARVGLLLAIVAASAVTAAPAKPAVRTPTEPDYVQDVAPILTRYCVACHGADEREADLALDSFDAISRGGESGPVIVAGDPTASHLIRLIDGSAEPKMPPDDQPGPNAEEIALLADWIRAGAKGPDGDSVRPTRLVVPSLPPAPNGERPITAVAWQPASERVAFARYGRVDLIDLASPEVRSFDGMPGKVNAIRFSTNGKLLATASGITGLSGRADLWEVATGERRQSFEGHTDAMLALALSPDGTLLATAGYDRSILLWEVASGELLRTFAGHNGAIYSLDFDPTGQLLLSASADQTLKVWRVADGERLDTLGQPLEEQWIGRFSADGASIYGAGSDSRIRRWTLASRGVPAINPIEVARFAHEGPIVAFARSNDGRFLASAAEDRTLKIWTAADLIELDFFENQSDIVSGLDFSPDGNRLVVARLDGSWVVMPIDASATPPSESTADATLAAPMTIADATPVEGNEIEPNDTPAEATRVTLPVRVSGTLHHADGTADRDLYRFEASAGETWMIEVDAARSGSPVDSFVEVLDESGQPVRRVLLQAVRDSYFTFRGKDSDTSDDFRVHNWEEMELNEFLYAGGEVVRLWLYPRGPDSGFKVYPGEGSRHTWFDTTSVSHALGAPCYIVRPLPVDARPIPNGLPIFAIDYQNDDDARRRWGRDSRLTFTAPRSGTYLVSVRDVRGFGGEDFRYRLDLRPQRHDFSASLGGRDPQVSPGSGREFSISVVREDDFRGPITVTIDGLPAGFHATSPLVVEADQERAFGVLWADPDAPAPTPDASASVRIVATAETDRGTIEHDLGNFGTIALAAPSKVTIRIVPTEGEVTSADALDPSTETTEFPWPAETPFELTIRPGQTIQARVQVQRTEFPGIVPFGNEDSGRNLPHGSFVDNIGLNGLMIIEGRTARDFFITASPVTAPQDRWFHLKARIDGEPCSLPILLHVVPAEPVADAPVTAPSEQ